MGPLLLHPSSSEVAATAHKTIVRVGLNTIASVRRGRRGAIAAATAAGGFGCSRLPAQRKVQGSLRAAGERSVLGADSLGRTIRDPAHARLWYFDLHAADIIAAYRRPQVTCYE